MSTKIKDLATELNVEPKEIKDVLMNMESRNKYTMKSLNIQDDDLKAVRDHFSHTGGAAAAGTVVRRRPAAPQPEAEPKPQTAVVRKRPAAPQPEPELEETKPQTVVVRRVRGERQRSFIPEDERRKLAEQSQNEEPVFEPQPQIPEPVEEERPAEAAEPQPAETPEMPVQQEPAPEPEEERETPISIEDELRKIREQQDAEENDGQPDEYASDSGSDREKPESKKSPEPEEDEEEEEDEDRFKHKDKNKNGKKKVIDFDSSPASQPNNQQRFNKQKQRKGGGGDSSSGGYSNYSNLTGKFRGVDYTQFTEDSGGGYEQKRRKKDKRKQQKQQPVAQVNPTKAIKKVLKLEDFVQVAELARRMGLKAAQLLSKLMMMGEMVGINDKIPYDMAQLLAEEFGFTAENVALNEETYIEVTESNPENMVPRPPVVTVMGHVDHGKTKLLDAIRHTNIVDREAGGITQHIGAYSVEINGGKITFLDTPGHEAFTAMRSRGAQATDVVILIVAADDGVMPQTVEAINHAKAANVPIIVAINKIDKPTANPAKVKNELLKYGIVAEELGGENLFVEISAKQRINIDGLLEAVLLQVEMMDLKADPTKPAEGIVIESRMDPGKGPVATVLVKDGTLKVGDLVVTGTSIGFVRSMMDWTGKRVKEATPSMAVEITGLDMVPPAGEKLYVFKDERKAKGLVELRINKQREKKNVEKKPIPIDEFFSPGHEDVKDLNVIVKGDVDGSVEAIIASLAKIEHEKIKVKVIHFGVGGINENDVLLASASHGMIIGFNVRVDNKAKQLAASEGVSIQIFSIIYELIDAIKAAMSGQLSPIIKEEYIGKLEVREIFKIRKVGTIAGCMVTEGRVLKGSKVKLVRDNVVVYSGKLETLKRFKDDVKEVKNGYECGTTIDGYNDIEVGDIIECYIDKEFKDEVL
ncbi:translation initiation factor IF-2 [bacterium]|nr:translation initiation factor IF-2 [bacterium]